MKRTILLLLFMLLMSAHAVLGQTVSAQTVLTDIWKDKDVRGPLKKIAVFWILKVQQNRILAEDEVVRQLKARGIAALPVYVVIQPDKFVERDAALKTIRDLGADAVLTLRLTDKRTAQSTIPQPGTAGSSRLSDYYQYVYDAPTRDESELVYLETNLFEVKTDRRIWTARSVTKVDVVDLKALSDFITLMIDRLAADGMIPR